MNLRLSHFQYGKWFTRISIMVKRFEESRMNGRRFHLFYAEAVEKIQFWCDDSIMTPLSCIHRKLTVTSQDSHDFLKAFYRDWNLINSFAIKKKEIILEKPILSETKKRLEILSWGIQHDQRHNFGQAFCLNQRNLSKTEKKGGLYDRPGLSKPHIDVCKLLKLESYMNHLS